MLKNINSMFHDLNPVNQKAGFQMYISKIFQVEISFFDLKIKYTLHKR